MRIRLRGITNSLLFYFLSLSLAYASGTYVPPTTSFTTTNENTYNVGKEYLYRESRAPTVTTNRMVGSTSRAIGSSSRTVGSTSRMASKSPSCNSCHSGGNAFSRRVLLQKKNQLEEIITDCNGPHRVYCHGGTSSMTNRASSIAYTLKVRYELGT